MWIKRGLDFEAVYPYVLIGVAKCWQVATCTSQSRLTSTIKICHFNATLMKPTGTFPCSDDYISNPKAPAPVLQHLNLSFHVVAFLQTSMCSAPGWTSSNHTIGRDNHDSFNLQLWGFRLLVLVCCGHLYFNRSICYLSRRMRKLQVRLPFCLSISLPLFWYRSPTILVSSWFHRWFKLFVTHSASPPKKCPPSFPATKAALIFWVPGGIVFPRSPDQSA